MQPLTSLNQPWLNARQLFCRLQQKIIFWLSSFKNERLWHAETVSLKKLHSALHFERNFLHWLLKKNAENSEKAEKTDKSRNAEKTENDQKDRRAGKAPKAQKDQKAEKDQKAQSAEKAANAEKAEQV